MLYWVTTHPQAAAASAVRPQQQALWRWLAQHTGPAQVLHAWRRVGRGAVLVVHAPTPTDLHDLLAQWTEFVPATFEVQPLLPAPPP